MKAPELSQSTGSLRVKYSLQGNWVASLEIAQESGGSQVIHYSL